MMSKTERTILEHHLIDGGKVESPNDIPEKHVHSVVKSSSLTDKVTSNCSDPVCKERSQFTFAETERANDTQLSSNDRNSSEIIVISCTSSNSIDLTDTEIISSHNVDEVVVIASEEPSIAKKSTEIIKGQSNIYGAVKNVENARIISLYRNNIIEISDDSDSSDSESSSTVSAENENDSVDTSVGNKNDTSAKKGAPSLRSTGELSIDDLPPIEDLEISVDETKCKEVGMVHRIVDRQVVVQSFRNTPPLDLDTVLFLDRGQRPLGKIFDVLDNVRKLLYTVRFNSMEHIKEKNITKDQIVYCAPQTEYTSYVDTIELMKAKGSDASWENNNEPPVTCIDFSDGKDEATRKLTIAPVGSKRQNQTDNDSYVRKMNQRNLELTAKRKKEDEARQRCVPSTRHMISNNKNSVEMVSLNSQNVSPFKGRYKQKNRALSADDQSTITRVVNFHHNAANASHANKFVTVPRSVNFLVGGYSSPSNFTFPPRRFLCSSPHQLPSVVPNAQNYLTMYSRPSIPSSNALPLPPPPTPFSTFSSTVMAAIPATYHTPQPAMTLSLPISGPVPPQYTNFNHLSAPSLPSSLPQPNFFPCTETLSVHHPTFIPLNVRPNISATSFHPQFVLPPPPPHPLPSMQHHFHQRDITIPRPDKGNSQPLHQQANASFYSHSSYNS